MYVRFTKKECFQSYKTWTQNVQMWFGEATSKLIDMYYTIEVPFDSMQEQFTEFLTVIMFIMFGFFIISIFFCTVNSPI